MSCYDRNPHNTCPSGGYPQPPSTCGCNSPAPGPSYPPSSYPGGSSGLPGPIPFSAGADNMEASLLRAGQTFARVLGYDFGAADVDRAMQQSCGPWTPDGSGAEHKLCCTPSIGRNGVRIAACAKLTRAGGY